MADKFPALDTIDGEIPKNDSNEELGSSDFLAREKELVGDEFQTAQDKEVLAESDDEINEFKEQFPEVDDSVKDEEPQEVEEPESDDFAPTQPNKFEGESKPLREWKERRDLEISEREKANAKRKEEIIAKAQQTIDDFYENYNIKKEKGSEEVSKEQEKFLEKRDNFLSNGTLWDRVNMLIDEAGELDSGERDKTRFKQLLGKLKGKENAPGASGY